MRAGACVCARACEQRRVRSFVCVFAFVPRLEVAPRWNVSSRGFSPTKAVAVRAGVGRLRCNERALNGP